MRRLLWILLALVLSAYPAHAQGPDQYGQCTVGNNCTGNLIAQATDCSATRGACVTLLLPQDTATAVVQVSGTYSGTLQFEQSSDGGKTWVASNGNPQPSGSAASSTTSTGQWRFVVSADTHFRVRCSTYASGTATTTVTASKGAATSGGGGAGTVTASGSPSAGNIPKFTSASDIAPAAYSDIVGLWTTGGPCTGYLFSDGTCSTSSGAPKLEEVLNPTADKSFDMGAFTLNFNLTGNWGSGYGYSVTSSGSNASTGPLLQLSTGASTNMDVFQACAQGTTNCLKVTKDAAITGTASGFTDSLNNVVTAARTYYVCGMANGSTCVSTDTGNGFNGNAAAAATIADTNNCTTVTTPCRTLAGVQAKLAGKRLNAIVTVYAADTANTGTDCYSPDSLIFTNPTTGRNPQTPNLGGRVESYPAAYLYLYGNPTTPANATIAKTCGSATIAANFAVGFDSGTTARINGFQVEGYGTTHIGARPGAFESLGGSALYVENITAIGNKQNSATDKAVVIQSSGQGSVAFMGGTHTVSNMGWIQASNGGMTWTYGPANDSTHNTVLSMTGAASDFVVMDALEDGKVFVDRLSPTFAGSGAYYFQQAMLRSTIIYTESYTAAECPTKCIVTTLNAPNAIFAQVAEGSFIDNDLCGTWSEGSCTVTQQPATRIVAKVLGMYRVTTANSVTAADQITSGGCIETFTIAGSKDAAICAPETVTMNGTTSGSASVGAAAAAGTPNKLLLPTATGSSGQFLKTDGANPQQLSWGDAAAVVGAGTAGVGPAYVGDAATAARSNHDHRSLHMLSFFMPGTPATSIQRQALVFPAGGVNFAITDMQVVVTTTSAADSAFNIQRCTANCTTGVPTFSSIYSTDLTLPANNRIAAKGSAPNQNVTSLVAGDQFRVFNTTIGASLSDVTVVMVVKWNTTN